MRDIPYRGKLGREHGEREFLQHSEIPAEYMLLHTSGKTFDIANDMHLEVMNQDGSEGRDLYCGKTEDEYFAMWDKLDTKGLFRNGEITISNKMKCILEFGSTERKEDIVQREEQAFKKHKFEMMRKRIKARGSAS